MAIERNQRSSGLTSLISFQQTYRRSQQLIARRAVEYAILDLTSADLPTQSLAPANPTIESHPP